MSGTGITSSPHGLGFTHVTSNWGWFVALGVGMLLAGFFALGDVVAVTLLSVAFIGALLLVGGVFQVVHAFMTRSWSAFALNLLGGLLYCFGGLLIMNEPLQGSIVITMILLFALVIGGVLRIVIGLRHRELSGWWLLVLGGVVSVVVGVMLYASLPWSGLWILGTLIGIELIFQGVTWLQFGLMLRRHRA